MMRRSLVVPAILVACVGAACAEDRGTPVKVLRRYPGSFDLSKRDTKDLDIYVTDERAWGIAWQKLCGEVVRPEVDFAKELVLVAAIRDENTIYIDAKVDAKGNLTAYPLATLAGYSSPMTGSYVINVISRDGIKSIAGKPVRKGLWRKVRTSPSISE